MNNDYMEFAEKMRRGIESVMGKEVKLHAVKKNNGVVLYGITILTDGCNMAPTLYLEKFYEDYKNGEPIKEIACEFMREYDRACINENINIDFFKDYEQIKSLLGYKLVNADMNVELLKEVPHKRFLNFAVVCYCDMPGEIVEKVGKGCILIKNEHLEIWNVSAEEIIEEAIQNMQETNPAHLLNMMEILKELYDDPNGLIASKLPMYVLTNTERVFGAGALLYDNQLEKVAEEIKDDFYILPSSLHEVIILPKKFCTDIEYLVQMVHEVNEEQVDKEERLAENVYFYSRERKELEIV